MTIEKENKREMSIVEIRNDIEDYFDLTVKLDNLKRRNHDQWFNEEGSSYSTATSRDIWFAVVNSTKPIEPSDLREKRTLTKIYKVLFEYTVYGEYPLLQQLCNYLGVNMEDFFSIISSPNHPDKNAYMWAYNVFEAAAQMNAIRGNGNANARQWIDKSREFKMASEDRVSLAIESKKIDKLEEIGAELAQELIGMSDDTEIIDVEWVEVDSDE